ncbi:MAG: hypothetical protein M3Y50_14200 [Acidobacteriota bacterium]|nr:hypothetical protein [Acidobacteriota bacterium]
MNVIARVAISALLFPTLTGAQQPDHAVANVPTAEPARIAFQFEREGLPIPRFTLDVREDGAARYQAEQAAQSSSDSSVRGQSAQHIDRPLTVTSATTIKIFSAARALDRFNIACASKAKNIANTGSKTLSYTGPDGTGSCVYNYSENKNVLMLTDTFVGIANTLDEGRRLDFLHRYDRLGLDAEMTFFAQQIAEGRALELATITPTLIAITEDTAVMERVRLRAAKMLEAAREGR